jgi:hypothetical protein
MKKQTAPLGLLLFFLLSLYHIRLVPVGCFHGCCVCVSFPLNVSSIPPPPRPNYMDIGNTLVPQVFGRRWLSFGAPCRCYCWRHGEKKLKKSKVVGRQSFNPTSSPPPLFFALQVDVIITLECSHSVLVSDVFSFFFGYFLVFSIFFSFPFSFLFPVVLLSRGTGNSSG